MPNLYHFAIRNAYRHRATIPGQSLRNKIGRIYRILRLSDYFLLLVRYECFELIHLRIYSVCIFKKNARKQIKENPKCTQNVRVVFRDARLERILLDGGYVEGLSMETKRLFFKTGGGELLEMDISFIYRFVEEVDPDWLQEYRQSEMVKSKFYD